MTTCPLCGQPDHPGNPCYAELRTEWKRREAEKRLKELPEWRECPECSPWITIVRSNRMMQEGL